MKMSPNVIAVLAVLYATAASAGPVQVTMRAYDEQRTGANLAETELTRAAVSSGKFGLQYTVPVDGQISGQILYMPSMSVLSPGGGTLIRNAIIVTTLTNNVYAFDADNGAVLWGPTNLGSPVGYNWMDLDYQCPNALPSWHDCDPATMKYNTAPYIGIMSTPAIEVAPVPMLFAVARIGTVILQDTSYSYEFRIFKIDLRNGAIAAQNPISGAVTGNAGPVVFDHHMQLQRPALTVTNGVVHVAFGSWQDTPPYHGWLFTFRTSDLVQTHVDCTTPGSGEGKGGIWMAGNGPVGVGNELIFMTGNGAHDGNDMSQSFVHVARTGGVTRHFVMEDNGRLDTNWDTDFGSSGPIAIPHTSLVVGAGKQSRARVFDLSTASVRQVFDICPDTTGWWYDEGHIHGSPVWFNNRPGSNDGWLYYWCEEGPIKSYTFFSSIGMFDPNPVMSTISAPAASMPGGQMTLSANGFTESMVWATTPISGDALNAVVPGVLRAFDAGNLIELWNSEQVSWRDSLGNFAKGAPVTVSNGHVYTPTFSNKVAVYGILELANVASYSGIPLAMAPRTTTTVSITMTNPSLKTWKAGQYFLKSVGSTPWIGGATPGRVSLAADVSPGANATFNATVTAPDATGSYPLRFRMTNVVNGVDMDFGDLTPNWTVQVTSSLVALTASPTALIGERGAAFDYCITATKLNGYANSGALAVTSVSGLHWGDTWTTTRSGSCVGNDSILLQLRDDSALGARNFTATGGYTTAPAAFATVTGRMQVNCTREFDPDLRVWVCQ